MIFKLLVVLNQKCYYKSSTYILEALQIIKESWTNKDYSTEEWKIQAHNVCVWIASIIPSLHHFVNIS